jgi:catechol 2,3-dioxygenase
MIIEEFGYAVYGLPEIDRAVDFFRSICQLEVSERRGDVVFLTGDTKHAWLRLEKRPEPGLIRLGFKVTDPAVLGEIASRLEKENIECSDGGTVADDRIANSIRFRVPQNFEVELYEEQVVLPASPAPVRGLERILHAVVFTDNIVSGRDFWTRTMGLLRSDQIEELVVFLRSSNGYHHSLALAKGEPGRLDHLCFLADNLDTVVKFRNHARANNVDCEDLVRHTASGSVSVYLTEPSIGFGIEICAGHDRIADENYNGRLLMAGPITANQWSVGFRDLTPGVSFGSGGGTVAGAIASAPDQSQ